MTCLWPFPASRSAGCRAIYTASTASTAGRRSSKSPVHQMDRHVTSGSCSCSGSTCLPTHSLTHYLAHSLDHTIIYLQAAADASWLQAAASRHVPVPRPRAVKAAAHCSQPLRSLPQQQRHARPVQDVTGGGQLLPCLVSAAATAIAASPLYV